MDGQECGKCSKLWEATEAERTAVYDKPQCKHCGVCYDFLRSTLCEPCKVVQPGYHDGEAVLSNPSSESAKILSHGSSVGNATRSTAATILDRRSGFTSIASQHHLNQPRPQNSSLLSASEVNRKVSALKARAKNSQVDIDFSLWVYPAQNKQVTAKRAKIPPSHCTFPANESARGALQQLLLKSKGMYCTIPVQSTDAIPSEILDSMFKFEAATFCTAKGSGPGGTAVIEDQVMDGSIEDLFVRLKHKRVLSDKDGSAKVPRITLHIYVYEIEWDNEEADNSPDIVETRHNSKGKSRVRKSAPSRKRKRSDSKDLASATPGPSTKRALYQSEYQRRPSAQGSAQFSFETFKFRQTTCTIATDGTIEPTHCEDLEEISIARNWQTQHRAKQLGGGYLGQGLTKLAIRGRYKGLDYAILQCKPISSSSNTNMKDLSDELCLLHKAQYFMDSFYKRALAHGVKGLPSMKWNIVGAFIGKLTDLLPPAPTDGTDDNRSLLYDVFLATPLLPSGALYREVKFSGNEQPGNNEDMIGRVVDAYSHHVLVDSSPDHSVTLFDPQAHIESQDSGYWDKGPDQIQLFQALHDCNQFCKALELEQHVPGFKH
ncbi:uncharacterized protein F5891DRAFT_1193674 [Suillus fuscotomentosus]|uniref:Alpha-type protein kinase domain-containing protein n=1 Tax=Suillus fuscotomentosus TaxID=1912939 RepID=A0AAD4HFM0_9AGAM|nr:uncharacterized protein F5891DRAFT_1193674 [Suillus fuscotomentosus]KAG1895860.1 hypothetical protein F5891DRAFT_1193674 [Suillus fuscotomentosus]